MREGSAGRSNRVTLRDCANVVWRWKWVVVAVALLCTLGSFFYSWQQTPQYRATAQLAYEQSIDLANPLTSGTYTDPQQRNDQIQSVETIVSNPVVSRGASDILAGGGVSSGAPYQISTELGPVTSTGDVGSVVSISAESPSAPQAARAANAYAQAFIYWRKVGQREQVTNGALVIADKLRAYKSATSRATSDYILLRQRLNDLEILAAAVTGNFQIVVPATVPRTPVAPRPIRSAMLGLGAGLLAGIGLAFVLQQTSTRVQSGGEVAQVLELPVIGAIPKLPTRTGAKDRLTALGDAGGGAVEAFRLLRSNLDYLSADQVSTLLVTSCLRGEGKTTTACNLAITLAMGGKSVILMDGDLRRPKIHDFFGLPNDIGVVDTILGQAKLFGAVQVLQLAKLEERRQGSHDLDSNPEMAAIEGRLGIVTSGSRARNPGELVASPRFGSLIHEATSQGADFVIVDSPPLLEVSDAAAMASCVDGLVMVVDVDSATRPTLREARALLAPLPCRKVGAVLTKSKHGSRGHFDYSYGS